MKQRRVKDDMKIVAQQGVKSSISLSVQHYDVERHICKLIDEISLTLEKNGDCLHTFSKPLKGVFHNIYLNLSIFFEPFSGTLIIKHKSNKKLKRQLFN